MWIRVYFSANGFSSELTEFHQQVAHATVAAAEKPLIHAVGPIARAAGLTTELVLLFLRTVIRGQARGVLCREGYQNKYLQ